MLVVAVLYMQVIAVVYMGWIKVLLNLYMMKSLLMHILSSSKHVLGFLDYIIILY